MLRVGATGTPNRLYVAETGTEGPANAGIQRWEKGNSGTWTKTATFQNLPVATTGFAQVTAAELLGKVYVVGVTLDTPAKLIRYIDDGGAATPTGTVLATAEANTQFRGVTLAPK